MNSSVETRYPFLDEDVFAFMAQLPPRWKLHGFREKYALRLLAERWVPKSIAWRPKAMFRAPFDSFHGENGTMPAFVEQLLSEESLRKTGFFDAQAVAHWRKAFRDLGKRSGMRLGHRNGPGRRGGDAAVVSQLRGREPGGFAVVGMPGAVLVNGR